MAENLQNKDYWIFDLDNTLYSHECNLFEQVDRKMSQYIAEQLKLPADEARKLQKKLFAEFNTTLNGLLSLYNIDADDYLHYTHDIDYSILPKNLPLQNLLERIEGDKYIFTNGPIWHAEKTLEQIGISRFFQDIFDIRRADYVPKPKPEIYQQMAKYFDIQKPDQAVMIDDMAKNLVPAADMGMDTVLLRGDPDYSHDGFQADSISFTFDNVEDFLNTVFGMHPPPQLV